MVEKIIKKKVVMKIFLDTACVDKIKEYLPTGLINGITTNPSNLSKSNSKDYKQTILEICNIVHHRDVSVEVTEVDPRKVYQQAKEIAALAPNVVVKIPCHKDYYEVIHRLHHEGVVLNITLVFTLIQSLYMAKLGVKYISPFIGRWDDIDVEGGNLLYEVRTMLDRYGYETELLAASIRGLRHLNTAINAGADIATLPVKIFEESMEHLLTDQGMAKFADDWKKTGVIKFP